MDHAHLLLSVAIWLPCFAEAMAFANPVGPETINGRLAMVGVLAAIGAELSTGESFFTQFEAATPVVLATWAIIALASLVPVMKGECLLVKLLLICCPNQQC